MSLAAIIAEARAADLQASPGQAGLTDRLVAPLMPDILAAVTRARENTNVFFSVKTAASAFAMEPEVAGDSNLTVYPVGFCAAIRDQVYAELARDSSIRSLRAGGVAFNKVFVILKNAYFQNAIQLGNFYLDAANDTVDPSKPFLECLPIPEVDYANLESWTEIAEVAERYYHCQVYPNLCFPLLAPLVPLLAVRDNGRLDLLYFQNLFFLKDLGDGLPRLSAWLSGQDTFLRRTLPRSCQDFLVRNFAANEFKTFPFEYRPSSPQDILGQVRDVAAAAKNPAQERLVLKLLEMAPQAVRIFRRLAAADSRAQNK